MTIKRSCEWIGCGKTFYAKTADVKRGWGRFCCKRCKAMEQESRTGQNARYLERRERRMRQQEERRLEYDYEDGSWDSHKGYFG